MFRRVPVFLVLVHARCGRFSSFLWNSNNLGEVRIDFFSEIESCINEIQYQVTKRRYSICEQNGYKMAKIDTLFMIKTAEKPHSLGPHILI